MSNALEAPGLRKERSEIESGDFENQISGLIASSQRLFVLKCPCDWWSKWDTSEAERLT